MAGNNTEARAGINGRIQYDSTSPPTIAFATPVTIPQTFDIQIPDQTLAMLDATNLESPNKTEEVTPGLIKLEPITFKMHYAPDGSNSGAAHKYLNTAVASRTKCFFKIFVPTSAGAVGSGNANIYGPFSAYVSKFQPGTMTRNGNIEATVTLTPAGSDSTLSVPMTIPT